MPIRVLVADDHGIVRDGLLAILEREPGLDVVAVEEDGQSALEQALDLKPDVAVLDIAMPRLTGVEACRKLREAGIPTEVLLLSVHKERSFVESGLAAGARGYVIKDAAARELVRAIETVAAGEVYLSPKVASVVVSAVRGGGPARPRRPSLTGRERDVLRLVAEGLTSKEIAQRLGIATKTVETHRASIMDKLEIRSVAGLTKYAIKKNLTSLGD